MALIVSGIWAWNLTNGWISLIIAFGIPVIIAVIWGVFAVPNDPSRSGKAPIVTSGIIRLIIELGIFAFAVWAFYDIGFAIISLIYGIIVIIHYAVSYKRIKWLLNQ
jgi:hypothetical protein